MKYEIIIGYEVHVQLSTDSKVFCGCENRFSAEPNTHVCPVCMALPGTLPVLNKKALDFAIRAALALNCDIAPITSFERKNYYYPDIPKNFQISQHRRNLGENGYLDIQLEGQTRRIGINNVHLEEDAGKIIHPEHPGANYSLIDLNRAGATLLEIVSEPDIRSAAESDAYMRTLKNLLEYIEVSDCNMHEGRLRFEVNMSMRPVGETALPNYRAEVKNLGSMKTAIKSIEYETRRQSRALDKGEKLVHDTRLWDEAEGKTRAMRSKESAKDYRYFPEPDLVEVEIDEAWLERVRAELPELPDAKRARFIEQYGLPEYDARLLTASRKMAEYYEQAVAAHNNPKAISNWIMTALMRELNERGLEADESPVSAPGLAALVRMIDKGTISGKIAKDVFAEMLASCGNPEQIVQEKGWVQVQDTSQVEQWVDAVIAENPGPAQEFADGKDKTLGFLVGQVMKLSRGKANPPMVNEIILKKLRGA